MKKEFSAHKFSRRDFLKIAGGLMGAGVVGSVLPRTFRRLLQPVEVASAQAGLPDLYFAGTDGWMYLPPAPAIPPFHPDNLAPPPFNTYIFGFRNITGLTPSQIAAQKMKAQHIAPIFWMDQFEKTGTDFKLQLTNLGLQMRPDLTDAHTVHFHGFRDSIPFFDGEPHGSVAVPPGKNVTYVYRPHDPGTYMYHCHVEDVEHVQMGMASMVYVRPEQNGNTTLYSSGKYAYNDGDGSTGFDREFTMMLTEVWAEAHWCDAHIQLPEWSDYKPDFYLLNGRVYPDTIAPNAPFDLSASTNTLAVQRDANGDLLAPTGRPELQYQPYSSLVRCNAGERVLLRFANLGFTGCAMTLSGIKMHIVGEDATPLRGRDGTDISYWTNSLYIHAGASFDGIFTAPVFQGPGTFDPDVNASYDTYLLYNRNYRGSSNLDGSGYGGQMTEVRVYPVGTLPSQDLPNT